MALAWKVDILELLKEKGYNSRSLRNNGIIGESSMTKIRNGEVVGINTLSHICDILEVQPGDLIKWEKNKEEQ